jgi:hypothetical protein
MPRSANKSSTSRRLSVNRRCLVDDLWRKAVAAIADFLHPLGYRTASRTASPERRDNAPNFRCLRPTASIVHRRIVSAIHFFGVTRRRSSLRRHFFYNGLTVSGYKMATPGMRVMDLKMRLTDSARVPFLNAAVHAVLFYVSTMFPPVFLVSLLSANKRCLHDMLAGVVVTRRCM